MKHLYSAGILLVAAVRSCDAGSSLRSASRSQNIAQHGQQEWQGTVNSERTALFRSTRVVSRLAEQSVAAGHRRPLPSPWASTLGIRGGSSSSGHGGAGAGGGVGRGGEDGEHDSAEVDLPGEGGIDEDLYSRQLYVMGKSAMAKMGKADVLISGMSGLGAEVAKNVILAGVRSVTLHDDRPASMKDLSSQFCLDEEAANKGTPRARASANHLRELNPYVDVRILEGPLSEEAIERGGYAAVLLVDNAVGSQLRVNDACRRAGSAFVAASSRGAFASLFCDFGESFVVEDQDGEEALACLVGTITKGEEQAAPGSSGEGGWDGQWVVEAVDGERHDFQTGDTIRLEGLRDAEGAPLDSPAAEFTVKNISPQKFSIDSGGWEAGEVQGQVAGGRAVQVKKPSTVSFLPLREALRPEHADGLILPTDFAKLDPSRQLTVHACFFCLDSFRRHNGGRFPTPGSATDAKAFLSLVENSPFFSSSRRQKGREDGSCRGDGVGVDEGVVSAFSRTCAGGLSPVSGFYGGVVAQEVLKGCSNLFMPTRQFMYYDCVEALPTPLPSRKECAARGDRYDGQRAVIGDTLQQRLFSRTVFVVGAGAIGCELLKSLALMGVGCSGGHDGAIGGANSAVVEKSSAAPGGEKKTLKGDEGEKKAVAEKGLPKKSWFRSIRGEGGGRNAKVGWPRWKGKARRGQENEERGKTAAENAVDHASSEGVGAAIAAAAGSTGNTAVATPNAAGVGGDTEAGKPSGGIVVTDMDTIEKSNLNRQFLFRSGDVGKAKSAAAAAAATRMNPALKIRALEKKVGADTEAFFDEDFWEALDCVVNALDNVEARLYVDSKCVDFARPLLESGTLGTKGNTQVVLPFQSESYGSSVDPEDGSIPLCTLKHHPYLIEHTVHWARDTFDGLFQARPRNAERLLKACGSPTEEAVVMQELRAQGAFTCWQALRDARADLEIDVPRVFVDCLDWSKRQFAEFFLESPQALLKQHPLGCTDDEGDSFWSGVRRPPTPLKLDSSILLHREFVWRASVLRAGVYGIDVPRSVHDLTAPAALSVASVATDEGSASVEDDERLGGRGPADQAQEPAARESDPDEKIEPLISMELAKLRDAAARWRGSRGEGEGGRRALQPVAFEKDDDLNGHVDFVTAASNLRALNYGIPITDRLSTKRIAGKIVPAIATTTAVVSGLACVELLKVIQGVPIEKHKNGFVNLAAPFVAFSEPLEAEPIAASEAGGQGFTIWDKVVVDGAADLTVRGLLHYLKTERGAAEVSMISYSSAFLYANFLHEDDDPVLDTPLWEIADDLDYDGGEDWMSRDAFDVAGVPGGEVDDDESTPGDIHALDNPEERAGVGMGDNSYGGSARRGLASEATRTATSGGAAGAYYDSENIGGSRDVESVTRQSSDPPSGGGGWADGAAAGVYGHEWRQQQEDQEEQQEPPPWLAGAPASGGAWGSTGSGPSAGAKGATLWKEHIEPSGGEGEGAPSAPVAPPATPPGPARDPPPPVADWFEEEFGGGGGGGTGGDVEAAGVEGEPSPYTAFDHTSFDAPGDASGVDLGVEGGVRSGERFYRAPRDGTPGAPGQPPGASAVAGDTGGPWGYPQQTSALGRAGVASHSEDLFPAPQGDGWAARPTKNVDAPATLAEKGSLQDNRGEVGGDAPRLATERARRRREVRRRRYLDLEVFCDDENGEELRVPPVRLDLRSSSRGAGAPEGGGSSSVGGDRVESREWGSGRAVLRKAARGAWAALTTRFSRSESGEGAGEDEDEPDRHFSESDDEQ